MAFEGHSVTDGAGSSARRTAAPKAEEPPANARSFAAVREHGGQPVVSMVGLAFLFFAVITAALALGSFWRQYRILHEWPVVDAQVLRSEIVPLEMGGRRLYSWDLQLLYTRGGKPQFGSPFPFNSPDPDRLRERAESYSVGSYHRVRFNPKQPNELRLQAGWNRRFFFQALLLSAFALGFATIGAVAFAIAHTRGARSV